MAVPAYQGFGQDQIKYALERSFVPNLENFKVFVVTDVIEDIILVEGVAADYNTREMFIAPHWIPRTVQKLILPNSGLLNIPFYIETKLMIIPEKDVDEYDVMLLAEDTCELVTQGSSLKCLLHAVQQKTKKKKINLMRGRRKTGVTKAYSKYKTSSVIFNCWYICINIFFRLILLVLSISNKTQNQTHIVLSYKMKLRVINESIKSSSCFVIYLKIKFIGFVILYYDFNVQISV